MKAVRPNSLGRAVRGFFGEYLPGLRAVSPHTVLSYRDALVLLLRFLSTSKPEGVAALDLDEVNPEGVIAFLEYLEKDRGNRASTRNVRLAAIHAFFRYVAVYEPTYLEQSQRVLAIPFKRTGPRPIEYLEFDEIGAVLDSIERSPPDGRRDYVMLATLFNTGARVQELLDVRVCDLQLIRPYQILFHGKGRKTRICALWPQTADLLRDFCAERGLDPGSNARLFLNHRGEPLTRYGVRYLLAKYCDRAQALVPSLRGKRLHPHSIRHSAAVYMLKSGADLVTISHMLGHASVETTDRYAKVDLEMKRDAIARAEPPLHHPELPTSWRKDASLLEWLESL